MGRRKQVGQAQELQVPARLLLENVNAAPAMAPSVNARLSAAMKPTAYLINTARGGIVFPRPLSGGEGRREGVESSWMAGSGPGSFNSERIDLT